MATKLKIKAKNLRKGDRVHYKNGAVAYVILGDATPSKKPPAEVMAVIGWYDGGREYRIWDADATLTVERE